MTVAILVIVNERSTSKAVSNAVIGIMQDRLARSAEKTYSICKLSQDFVQKAVDTSLSFGEAALKNAGGIQVTGRATPGAGLTNSRMRTPPSRCPSGRSRVRRLIPDRSFDHPIPVIDDIAQANQLNRHPFPARQPGRGHASRSKDRGRIRRPARQRHLHSGHHAGRFAESGGQDRPFRPDHRGRAYVVNAWYTTAYEPLRNAKGDIIGMFYVGIKQEGLTLLRQAIATVAQRRPQFRGRLLRTEQPELEQHGGDGAERVCRGNRIEVAAKKCWRKRPGWRRADSGDCHS